MVRVLVLALCAVVCCSFSASAEEFVSYVSPLAGFAIAFPEGWEVENPPESFDPTLMLSARSGEAWVWVTLEYRYYTSFDAFKERVRSDILLYPGVQILGEGRTEIDHVPAYWYVYSFPEWGREMQGILYLFSRNEGFYRIICWTSRETFDAVFPTFRKIVRSFTTRMKQAPE
ncbi:PsbP-related protein [Candidatus Caldatribacterium saccharofermentans]|uniref:PsbP C-terminal domain-containing protein n=1 Tax=Candidatus Caldatribacterium saccharofermentans TaxID=1454753 RepID=A0A7V4WL78_9BACT